jgi:predicted ATPase/class 3 adenylate cyclase
VHDAVTTFLFTDIEGSTRLWEEDPARMRPALARHDGIVRGAVERRQGRVVKMTGDGLHAAFTDPLDAVLASVELQQALAQPGATEGLELRVRCGLHAGVSEGRDGDFYGSVVNRAARIMAAAHGGQILLSHSVVEHAAERLPSALSLRDLGMVRLRDLGGAERLYQLVAPELRSEFPALRTLEGTPNNLPQAVSSFVGRTREIADVARLLARHRLVTLVGMGGLGKTRLSLHVAAESLDEHLDGVWLVELGPLKEAQRVPLAIAATLGVKEEGGRPIEEALARHVKDRAMLVMLDNCEHLLEASATAARHLLSSGANVRVLATSREPLRIAGESTYVISGLPVPGPLEAMVPEALEGYESVQLFVDRAAAALPGFEMDEDNATPIAAICHRLDGIPLAIELAAARCRSISVPQIASRLKDRFRLLTGGDPTAMPRQRTLRALIDWSYDLLPDEERVLLRRLAIFAGGWTLEAAEAICGEDVAGIYVVDLLSRLVEKSLVIHEVDLHRYAMLETVREYALERLLQSGELETVADRHFEHFLDLCARAKPKLAPGDPPTLAMLDAERENIAAAHARAGQSAERAVDGLRLVDAMKLYWVKRGLLEMGHRMTEEAILRADAQGETPLRAAVLLNLGQFRYFMGRYAEAANALEASLALARAVHDAAGLPRVLQTLGMVAIGQGKLGDARARMKEAIDAAVQIGDQRSLAGAVNALAMLLRVEGDFHGALPLYRRAVELFREVGDREAECIPLLNLAMSFAETGGPSEALQALADALRIAHEIGSVNVVQSGLEVCAGLAAMRRDWKQAARFYGAAESAAGRTGVRRDAADEAFLAPRMKQARTELGESSFAAAAAEGMRLEPERASLEARSWLAAATAAMTV